MRLKSLDVVGFKSFCEPTVIGFSPGITAVVGPNGCGKSNVVDAIRWVLGEQAPTRLRGKSSEDLIYAGNESNQPAGMAEVTLLLEAEEHSPLPEPFAALSEIAVTRRLYRSGDSEYLLNRIPCRLKDITEFFLAAQIHSRGYALVEQGRIDEVIQAKPAELRAMVEEAAGLALFKGRREMSERKLERVRENLSRVDDVLSEIERQLNFARRQAKKAEAYKIIRAELGGLEQLAMARRILEQHTELSDQSQRQAELAEQAEAAHAAVASSQNALDEATLAMAAARDALADTHRDLATLRTGFDERLRTRTFLERRRDGLDELMPNLDLRLTQLAAQATAARAGRAVAGARLARESRGDDGGGETRLAALREEHRTVERALRDRDRRVESIKDELAELMREAAVIRGRLGDLAGERSDNERRLAALIAEAPALAATLASTRTAVDTAANANDAARDDVTQCEARQRESAEREFALRTALDQSARGLSAAHANHSRAALNARRLLAGGAGQRLHGVLSSLNGDGPATPPALLLDVMKAPPALEPALRAVLGDQLDGVIVDSPGFALQAIDILKRSDSGRLSFIPASLPEGDAHKAIVAPGVAGRLLDMVEVEARFVPLAEALLGHVMIVDDLHAALAATNLNGRGAVFVTREGDLLWPDRIISGGSSTLPDDAEEIDMRKRAAALQAAALATADAEADHEQLIRLSDWARIAIRDEIADLSRSRSSMGKAEHTLNDARSSLAKVEQRLALAEANRNAAERRAGELTGLGVTANERLEALAFAEQGTRTRLATAAAELADARAETRRLNDAILAAGQRVEARKASLAALAQELRHQRDIAAGLDAQSQRHREELDRAIAERAEFASELAGLVAQDEVALARRLELETALNDLQPLADNCERELAAARAALKNASEQRNTLGEAALQCQLRRERARTLGEELERGFAEKFATAFALVTADLQARLADRDPLRDAERLSELHARAERIGEVNLAADSEVKELDERGSALSAERADLQKAADDLAQTIQKLNREVRKRFAETFDGAARNFSELFPKLLRGGKGHLELLAGDDATEAGVNILVQPAGKRVKEIGLLSGGEKALSAMALIFSLFLLNPSPFCVMDEVDAPLDEFSLAAFTALMRELKERSQFIIITHNQRTMQAADQIHGVTMERPGISRIISLNIPQAA